MTTCQKCGGSTRVRTSRDCGGVQERRHECKECKAKAGKTYEPRKSLTKCCMDKNQT
jgi:hypothetical protein